MLGIDYTHPALGGCFGPSCRVAYGHDFVGDSYDGTNQLAEDSDPHDSCNGHGTHVAGALFIQFLYCLLQNILNLTSQLGIIGANDSEKGFFGVAPDGTSFHL
jgi:subtilisin family serine protease